MTKKQKIINILFILASFLLIVLPSIIVVGIDSYYKATSDFIAKDGVINFSHEDEDSLDSGFVVSGDMEFYYNKWLITDGETDAEKDGYLSLPNFWTKLKVDGHSLPKDGYATYRFKVYNLPLGSRLTADYDHYYSSCRIFFDDVLVGQIGEPSKIHSEDKSAISFSSKGSYLVTKSVMTVTIEAGNTGHGGIKKGPKIISSLTYSKTRKGRQLTEFILLGIMVECFALLIITRFLQSGFKKTLHIFATSAFLFLYWLFSGDGLFFFYALRIPITYMVYKTVSVIALGLFILSATLYVLFNKKLIRHKYEPAILVSLAVIFIVFRSLFIYSSVFVFLFMLFIIIFSIYFFYLYYKSYHTVAENLYVIMFAVFFGVVFLYASDDANLFYLPLNHILSTGVFIGSILFYLVFFIRILDIRKKAKTERGTLQNQDYLKALALHNQINPNFIFNTLSIIEDNYHKDINKGDSSLSCFSDALRYNILTIDKVVVPFSDEVDNLMQFVDFHSKRENFNLSVLLNIDTYEFMIPPITIVPLFNQFLAHTFHDISEEKNLIELSTVENKNEIVVQFIDHRGAYDIDAENQHLKDLIERIHLTVKGKVKFSKEDDNTIITITIPKHQKEEMKNENHSRR